MTLVPLDRESEPYSRYGNISADGIQRLLGAPHLDAMQILVRETVQNSWDAGKDLPGTVDYRIRFRELTDPQRKVLRESVFNNLPKYSSMPGGSIRDTLNQPKLSVIEICDFGTTGLGGTTQADSIPGDEGYSDFVDFLRNIGSPRNTIHGGGTYGFGKSCLYGISRCQAILVDSAMIENGRDARRFMACRIASRYDISSGADKGRYTGRHWWGRMSEQHLEPEIGADAADLSEALGMYPRKPQDHGTSIAILAPELKDDDLRTAANEAIQNLLWYCWPKFIAWPDVDFPPMTFAVEVNGEECSIPDPEDCPPLNLYANSLQLVRSKSKDCDEIRSQRPSKHLGRLHISRDIRLPRLQNFIGENELFPEHSSHVAMMRPAELVVKYMTGDQLPSDEVEWGGVFVCSDEKEVEQAFAAAEPPAHDDWNPRSLPSGHKKTFVRVALRRISQKISELTVSFAGNPDQEGAGISLGKVADALGVLLSGGNGQRLGRNKLARRAKGTRSSTPAALSQPVFVGHEKVDGRSCALFELTATGNGNNRVRIDGSARISRDGGGADTTDPRGGSARVIAWRYGSGREEAGESVELIFNGKETLTAVVEFPADKAITFNAEFELI